DDYLQEADARVTDMKNDGLDDVREAEIVSAPHHHGHVLDNDGDPDGGDQGGQPGRSAQGTVSEPLGRPSQRHAHGHGHRQRPQYHQPGRDVGGVAANESDHQCSGHHRPDHHYV